MEWIWRCGDMVFDLEDMKVFYMKRTPCRYQRREGEAIM